jgi:hypothetical protein
MVSTIIYLTSQYYSISRYKNLKRKILKCDSNIYFNKECINEGLVPKYSYARIKVPNTSPTTKFTNTKAQELGIKDEIKFYTRRSRKKIRLLPNALTISKRMEE